MTDLPTSYRPATRQDAPAMAELVNMAGEGLALYLWTDMFVPLQQLEDLAPGTWYVNVLATYPSARRKGYGTELLAIAEDLAADCGKRGLSIIVSDANTGARRLYERLGYTEQATRPMVKEQWESPGQNWVLLLNC